MNKPPTAPTNTWKWMDIEQLTRQLLRDCGIAEPPVNVERIAAQHAVKVQKADLGPDCSGALVRNGSQAVIGVQWSHHGNRQRFSIAHELGHFFLHPGGQYLDRGTHVRFRDKASGTGTVQEEREANHFAAAILIPEDWLRSALSERPFDPAGEDVLQHLAERFAVSTQTMSIRLDSLGLLRELLPGEAPRPNS